MRRTVMNKRVIQAMTIGIAAVMAVNTVPMTAFAAEETPSVPENDNENKENTAEENISVSEAMSDCDAAEGTADTASADIDAAVTAVEAIDESKLAAEDELNAIVNDLTEGKTGVTEADAYVEAAEDSLSTVQDILDKEDSEYNTAVDTANAALNGLKDKDGKIVKVEDKFAEYDEADKEGTESSDSVIAKAETANTSDDENEAKQAKSEAADDLKVAEEALVVAANAYNDASAAVDTAQNQYDMAVIEKAKADEALQAAKEAIKNADTNATAANERLKAAQAKVDALAGKVETLKENKEALTALKENYYNFMVHYYRDKNIASAVYYDDGSLNVEESAKKAVKDGKTENTVVTENTYILGRDLMKKIIYFELTANGVDPATIKYAEQEKGLTKKTAAEGDRVTDNNGNARVTINNNSKYDIWMDNTAGEDGRYHNVKVTYTVMVDGEPQEVTKYYNDIFKANMYDQYADAEANIADMASGPIYVGEITKENGKPVAYSRNSEDFRLDDYQLILDAIKAVGDIEEYEAAKKAVDTAASDVARLQSEIENLKKVAVDSSKIDDLKERLETAQATLAETTNKKQALEEKVEEAREAYKNIDLSRFVKAAKAAEPGVVAPPEVSEEGDVTPDTPALTAAAAGIAAPQYAPVAAGVAGAAYEGEAIADAEVPLADTVETPVVVEKDNEINQFKSEERVAENSFVIEDSEVPLATMPTEEGTKMNWWWLLIIAILGATGRALYEEHKKAAEVEVVEEDSNN